MCRPSRAHIVTTPCAHPTIGNIAGRICKPLPRALTARYRRFGPICCFSRYAKACSFRNRTTPETRPDKPRRDYQLIRKGRDECPEGPFFAKNIARPSHPLPSGQAGLAESSSKRGPQPQFLRTAYSAQTVHASKLDQPEKTPRRFDLANLSMATLWNMTERLGVQGLSI